MQVTHQTRAAIGVMVAVFLSLGQGVFAQSESKPAVPAVKEAAGAAAETAVKEALPEVVAKVNGTPITALEFKRANKVLLAGARGAQIAPEQKKEMEGQVLEQLIKAELLYQASQKLEVKDLDAQVEAKLAQNKAKIPNFEKAVKELDMTEKDLREFTKRDLMITNFVEKTIVPKLAVTEADSKKFYDDNPDRFTRPESVKASHILIGVDQKATADEKKAAREKAEKLLQDLKKGADFAELAKANSTCPSSKQGGDLGFFGKGQMVPPFEKAAFALKPGEVSDLVETSFGYHIIRLAEKKASEKADFKDARPRIDDYLKNQKIGAAINDFVTEAKKAAKIETFMK